MKHNSPRKQAIALAKKYGVPYYGRTDKILLRVAKVLNDAILLAHTDDDIVPDTDDLFADLDKIEHIAERYFIIKESVRRHTK